MILLIAVALGLVATTLRAKITGRRLKPIALKSIWLVFVAGFPQILAFEIPAIGKLIPESVIPIILIVTQGLLLGFAILNILTPGVWLLGLGLLGNFLAIVVNGGWMPISPEVVRKLVPALPGNYPLEGHRLGLSKDWILTTGEIKLSWLSDRFTLPAWSSYQVAFSLGDIFIAIGAILLLWSLSNLEKRSKNDFSKSG